ncbi:MAG: hypothetical protein GY737_00660 [Desulfobacteraceae bacterium]|nr:hypothetical protein [Desulfobacteraceae bacterium]
MIENPKKRDVFDFELGYLKRSPCLTCEERKSIPECYDRCKRLDEVRTVLARGISSQKSSFR